MPRLGREKERKDESPSFFVFCYERKLAGENRQGRKMKSRREGKNTLCEEIDFHRNVTDYS